MADRIGMNGMHGVPQGARVITRGVIFVHSCPRALCAHIEWAIADVLGTPVSIDWSPQPVLAGNMRGEVSWTGAPGTASRLVSILHGWGRLRLEVTEEPNAVSEGERYSISPALGVFRAVIGAHGDIQVSEERLRAAIARCAQSGASLEDEIAGLLGAAWDSELEPFRYAGEGAEVRWLHQVVS